MIFLGSILFEIRVKSVVKLPVFTTSMKVITEVSSAIFISNAEKPLVSGSAEILTGSKCSDPNTAISEAISRDPSSTSNVVWYCPIPPTASVAIILVLPETLAINNPDSEMLPTSGFDRLQEYGAIPLVA